MKNARTLISARSRRALALVALTAALCMPVLALRQRQAAARDRAAAYGDWVATAERASRLLALRGSEEGGPDVAGLRGEPGADLVSRLRGVMRAVGIPEASLRDVRQADPTPLPARGSTLNLGDAGLVRLAGSATIGAVSPADAARLLARWRAQEPGWTVATIAMRASTTRGRGEVLDLFDLEVSFEGVAAANSGRAAPSEGS